MINSSKNSKKKAQSLIEYGLILALVALIALTVLSKFGKSITDVGDRANNAISTAGSKALDNYCKGIDPAKAKYNESTGECTSGS